MNLIPSEIRRAINNDSNDILDEDEDYRDGLKGDVINVETTLPDHWHGVLKKEDEEDKVEIGPDATETNDRPESGKWHCTIST